jgi:hypothetical protein
VTATCGRAIWRGASLDGLRGVVTFVEVLADPEELPLATPFWSGREPPTGPSVAVRYVQPDGLPILFPSRDSVTEPWTRLSISRVTGGGIFEVQAEDWEAVMTEAGGWPLAGAGQGGGPRPPATRARRITAAERTAIERRAVSVARAHLERSWDTVDDVGAVESYDLHCASGATELRVEVKGTTAEGLAVVLTANEVEHARSHAPHVALAVVSGIVLGRKGHESPTAAGGVLTMWSPWDISRGHLTPTEYAYGVPPGGRVVT